MSKQILITTELANAIGQYLSRQPYADVAVLIAELSKAAQEQEEKPAKVEPK